MKLAVLFPGVGYHVDKPLLYYAKDLAASLGYEYISVEYGKLPDAIKGSKEKMQEAFLCSLKSALALLDAVEWEKYGEITFISKSIGTAVAAETAHRLGLKTRNIYYTRWRKPFPSRYSRELRSTERRMGGWKPRFLKKPARSAGYHFILPRGQIIP